MVMIKNHVKGAVGEKDISKTFETALIIEIMLVREGYLCEERVSNGTLNSFEKPFTDAF